MNDHFVTKVKKNPVPAAIMFLALTAQVFHAYHLFLWSGHSEGVWGQVNAVLYAGSIELAIAVFVLLGWTWVSWAFAVGSMGVNVAYYTNAHADTYGWGFMFDSGMVDRTWFFWLLAIFLPVGIAAFAHATEGHGQVDTDTRSRSWPKFGHAWSETKEMVTRDPDTVTVTSPVTDPDTVTGDPVTVTSQDTYDTVTCDPDTDVTRDDKDQAILDFLGTSGPSTKSEIAKAVDMSVGSMDRKKNGKRSGRLVKLEDAGLVTYDQGEGVWDVVKNDVWSHIPVTLDGTKPSWAGHRNGYK